MAAKSRVLLLGGSGEAVPLAAHLAGDPRVELITTLKGATPNPTPLAGDLRVGGFGGAKRLQRFLEDQRIGLVVDATHPFAQRIARNAWRAAVTARIPRLKLWRPAWTPTPADRWFEVDDASAAHELAQKLGQRPFVSLGRSGLTAFPAAPFAHVLYRAITSAHPLPANATLLTAKGPFTLQDEQSLLQTHAIDVLVTKNSGGQATAPKLAAARSLALPVILLRRPPTP
ncbi:MAG: cobalt-precorrin-6A reductase, partial [Geminicoccaceae bacterium]